MNKMLNFPRLLYFLATVLGTFSLGYFFNTYYQAQAYRDELVSRSQMAVFPDPSQTADVLGEKLRNLDGVRDVQLITQDTVLDLALKTDPSLKEVLVTGTNPFGAYFIVYPKTVTPESVETLRTQISDLGGIEDIRYDRNLVNLTEKLRQFDAAYLRAARIIVICILMIVAGRFLWRQFKKAHKNYLNYLYLVVTGVLAGILGGVLYYLVQYRLLPSQVTQLSTAYSVYFLAGGALLSLLWEN